MSVNVVIDPLTRIEGHLRVELEHANGVIAKAWSETTQFRGLEEIVKNRDPRDVWAFLQRICGVCTSVHAIASISAVENALGIVPPEQARRIRDIVLGAQEVQDHVIHFYHLHALDWVDVVSAASADPAEALEFARSIGSTWKGNTLERFTAVRDKVVEIAESGQLSIFTGGYWGHEAYKLPPAANLMAVSHYLDALEFQRSVIRIVTTFGGKNPHPNFLVGGMACSIDPNRSESINQVQLDQVQKWIDETLEFVNTCYVPDGLAILSVYGGPNRPDPASPDWFTIGATAPNFLALGRSGAIYSGDPAKANVDRDNDLHRDLVPGVVLDGELKLKAFDPRLLTESITSAWYTYADGKKQLHPSEGETSVKYTGPKPPYPPAAEGDFLADSKDGKYTWCKEPRYDGRAMQVGPAARVLSAYLQGDKDTVDLVNTAVEVLGIEPGQLNSTAGRTLARAVEAATAAKRLNETFAQFAEALKGGDIDVFDGSKWDPSTWPKDEVHGYSFVEVARGNLSHWVSIKGGKVTRYQAVVPTTWLASGRDPNGVAGPYEEALGGDSALAAIPWATPHPLIDPEQPVEVMRTIHSFDPCMSCAVHLLDPDGNELGVVTS
ncbi:MAG: nickel-dependent hydrogenase large subunit [Micrococcales bacterium]|nr:nickel-dependent hydrogenase large subunit [Micrococcales bacterium]MCL2667004.1 nickel-dependent hydrogenase large subunit [Micrococcales bacterium]